MTAPTDREQAQAPRVSDDILKINEEYWTHNEEWCQRNDIPLAMNGRLQLDLRDARARHKVDSATIAERDAEIARLTTELATARVEGWRAGRDAAADCVGEVDEAGFALWPDGPDLEDEIRALTPPSEDRADG